MGSQLSIIIYVKYEPSGTERPLQLPNGSKLPELEGMFLKVFNDKLPQGSKPCHFKFMWFNGKEYVDLPIDQVLLDKDKIMVIHTLVPLGSSGPVIPHPISHGMSYYHWSVCSHGQVNDAILKKDDTTLIIKCDGKTTDKESLIKFTAVNVGTMSHLGLIAFTLPSPTAGKVYVVKGQEEDQDIIVEEMNTKDVTPAISDEFKFDCIQFYGKMEYKCFRTAKGRDDLYISAMKDGSAKLQALDSLAYPRPSALYIAELKE